MEKPVCSLAVAVTEEELTVNQNEFGDETVTDKKVAILQGHQNNSKDSVVNGARGHTVSAIFPPEVWEVILEDEVVKSEDIHNVLLAFPELDKPFQNIKAMWLFGAVLPHLMTKHLMTGKPKDLFKLRLVSKRWKASVDSSLENHAALQHLPSPSQKDYKGDHQKIMLSENHFSYHRPQVSKIGASILRTDQQIDEFLTSMTNHPGNPFPGKYLAITLCNSSMDVSLALFEKFGKHILFLEIDLQQGSLKVCQNALICLFHVTNLRSLTIIAKLSELANQETDNFFSKPEADNLFPELPNLEAFNWHVDFLEGNPHPLQPSRWIVKMIQKYGGNDGLGRLGIPADQHQLVPFNNLTSITEINLIVYNFEVKILELAEDAFRKLSNPLKLRKLRLDTRGRIDITKLINFLAGYNVESLKVDGLREEPFEYSNEAISAAAEVTSITTLYFKDELKLRYDFLKWLPNLQHLTIHFTLDGLWQWRDHFKEGIKPDDSLAKRIRGFVLMACDKRVKIRGDEEFSIWKELPKLRMLSATVMKDKRMWGGNKDSFWSLRFVRECGDKAIFSCKPNDQVSILEDDLEERDDWEDDEIGVLFISWLKRSI